MHVTPFEIENLLCAKIHSWSIWEIELRNGLTPDLPEKLSILRIFEAVFFGINATKNRANRSIAKVLHAQSSGPKDQGTTPHMPL